MKLLATISPNKAGYQSPIFFTAGENTDGKLKTIQMKPRIQIILMRIGRFTVECMLFYVPIYQFADIPIVLLKLLIL